jgi:hypothetical protein
MAEKAVFSLRPAIAPRAARHGEAIAFGKTMGGLMCELKKVNNCYFWRKNMNKARFVTIGGAICVAVIAAVMIPIAKANSCGMDHGQHSTHETQHETKNVKEAHAAHLAMISKSIDNAIQSIEAGNSEPALAELKKAQQMLAVIKESLAGQMKSEFVNAKCPMMGSPINPEKISDNLIREFKGQQVAFCCGGCPDMWDKLSDAQKEAKLSEKKAAAPTHNH